MALRPESHHKSPSLPKPRLLDQDLSLSGSESGAWMSPAFELWEILGVHGQATLKSASTVNT